MTHTREQLVLFELSRKICAHKIYVKIQFQPLSFDELEKVHFWQKKFN